MVDYWHEELVTFKYEFDPYAHILDELDILALRADSGNSTWGALCKKNIGGRDKCKQKTHDNFQNL